MKILVLGADGYLGWPTSLRFLSKGHTVCLVDNYSRRKWALETNSSALIEQPFLEEKIAIFKQYKSVNAQVRVLDCCDFDALAALVDDFQPDVLIHFAEQPSAPYSMIGYGEARATLQNNLFSTFNVIWAVSQFAPNCHIIKLGTMGEYGTPNIDIEEGWIDIKHKGREDTFLFPRQAGSLYHTTKILDTDLLWFYVRSRNLRVTDLMQGPVYGLSTIETDLNESLTPNFHYDDIFGTVLNRFLVQAVAGIPLTVYGQGDQIRGYLNLNDTLQCIELAVQSPAELGQLRIFNQFTETFSVNQLADKVISAAHSLGLEASKQSLPNPRKELEEHYYNPVSSQLKELGLHPTLMTENVLSEMLNIIQKQRSRIQIEKVLPRVRWA